MNTMTIEQAQAQEMKKQGWELFGTGGGCDAYMLGDYETRYALLTALNDSNIPTEATQEISIDIYDSSLDEDMPLAEIQCKFEDILTKKVKVKIV